MGIALIIEPRTYVKSLFMKDLNAMAHCCVRSAETLDNGLKILEQVYCDVVLVTVDQTSMK
jgi:hypothetical protein